MQRRYFLIVLYLAIGFIAGILFSQSNQPKEEHGHDHRGGEVHEVADGVDAPEITLEVLPDPKGGYNLHLSTKNFTFAPQNASLDHKDGEGHAHVYVDGEKVTRLYGEWAYLGALEPGEHKIEVSLNTNDHKEYAKFGVPVVAMQMITVGEETEMKTDHSMTDKK